MRITTALLAACCAFGLFGAAHAATPVVDCTGVAHWSNRTGYLPNETMRHNNLLYRIIAPAVQGQEPQSYEGDDYFQLLGRCDGQGNPITFHQPLEGSYLYQGVPASPAFVEINTAWDKPVARVSMYYKGKVFQEMRPPILLGNTWLPLPTELGPARFDALVAYTDGTEVMESINLEVRPATEVDTMAPPLVQPVVTFAGVDSVSLRWNAVKDSAGGSGGVRYRVKLARQAYIVDEGGTSITLSNLRPDTRHLIQVEAIDRAGRIGPAGFVFAKTML